MCNVDFLTIGQIKSQELEINRIDTIRKNPKCGNCADFVRDPDFREIVGICEITGSSKTYKEKCEDWKPCSRTPCAI